MELSRLPWAEKTQVGLEGRRAKNEPRKEKKKVRKGSKICQDVMERHPYSCQMSD
jgi:hypothetical protein